MIKLPEIFSHFVNEEGIHVDYLLERKPASFAETALPGRAGKQIGELLKTAEQQGTRVLAKLVKQALNRMGNSPMGIRTATTMFTRKEREELADALANAIGTANLLGRARIRGLLARKVRIPFAEGGWDESKHPRDPGGEGGGQFTSGGGADEGKKEAKGKQSAEPSRSPKQAAKEWKEKGTDAPAFKAWFGDSKVVDESGKPLVVYHGATQDFDKFQGKSFFTNKSDVAGSFAISRQENAGEDNPAARTFPVYLSIKKPFVIDAKGKAAGDIQFARNDGYGYRKALDASTNDGVIIINTKDEGNLYIPKQASQIKSATANRGTFDPKSDDIRFADTPIVKPIPPEAAIEYFKSLVPSIAVDPETFGPLMRRQAFTMAATTDLVVLKRVQDALTASLETGTGGAWSVQEVLDSAGVTVKNPQYAEMVWRTNTHSAYLQGSEEERMEPDVVDYFPAWMWSTVVDGRERERHGDLDGKLFPGTVSFQEVRGTDAADVINCRCVPIPMTADEIGDRKIETSW